MINHTTALVLHCTTIQYYIHHTAFCTVQDFRRGEEPAGLRAEAVLHPGALLHRLLLRLHRLLPPQEVQAADEVQERSWRRGEPAALEPDPGDVDAVGDHPAGHGPGLERRHDDPHGQGVPGGDPRLQPAGGRHHGHHPQQSHPVLPGALRRLPRGLAHQEEGGCAHCAAPGQRDPDIGLPAPAPPALPPLLLDRVQGQHGRHTGGGGGGGGGG